VKLSSAIGVALFFSSPSEARDYRVSPVDPQAEYSSLSAMGSLKLFPGDRVLLDGGHVYPGSIHIGPQQSGDSRSYVMISSYGSGRATIEASPDSDGILIQNAHHVEISSLRVKASNRNGIHIQSSTPSLPTANIIIRDVEVFGAQGVDRISVNQGVFEQNGTGILVNNQLGGGAVRNVWIDRVHSHHHLNSGVRVGNCLNERHSGIEISRARVHDNWGVPNYRERHSGSGIEMGGVSRSRIVLSVAYDNGRDNIANGGPIGIWAWNADQVTISDNVSFRNRTSSRSDGGGFDLDGSVSDSIMEGNIAFENDGAGFLLCDFPWSEPVSNVVVRNNLSFRDGRKNRYGGLSVSGRVHGAILEGNSIFLNSTRAGSAQPSGFFGYEAEALRSIVLRDNSFFAASSDRLVDIDSLQGVQMEGNQVLACGSEPEARVGTDLRKLTDLTPGFSPVAELSDRFCSRLPHFLRMLEPVGPEASELREFLRGLSCGAGLMASSQVCGRF
jgi:hypothetical protein